MRSLSSVGESLSWDYPLVVGGIIRRDYPEGLSGGIIRLSWDYPHLQIRHWRRPEGTGEVRGVGRGPWSHLESAHLRAEARSGHSATLCVERCWGGQGQVL